MPATTNHSTSTETMSLRGKINRNPDRNEVRHFGRRTVLFAPVAALAWLGLIRLLSGHWLWLLPAVILAVGLPVGLACALAPGRAGPVHVAWHGLVAVLDWVVVTVALALVFFLVFTPVGLALRLAGRRLVLRRPDPALSTYWKPSEKVIDLQRYRRPF
jgi:hypothetical protein